MATSPSSRTSGSRRTRPRRAAPRVGRPEGPLEFIAGVVAALPAVAGAENLKLKEVGPWDPATENWGEGEDARQDWVLALVARGPRPAFEMEMVTPGDDPRGYGDGPILGAIEMRDAGNLAGARRALEDLIAADVRCLDAHAHLGDFAFDKDVRKALSHYLQGLSIGERALGPAFAGVLPWGIVENRPFLRCLHGYGLCLWRLGLDREAAEVFARMLWLNPSDNQGARFLLDHMKQGLGWQPDL